jgi:hypothetical protein
VAAISCAAADADEEKPAPSLAERCKTIGHAFDLPLIDLCCEFSDLCKIF